MTIVSFPFTTKYKGRWYAPSASIPADDSDVDKLVALGAKAIARSADTLKKVSTPPAPQPTGQVKAPASRKR